MKSQRKALKDKEIRIEGLTIKTKLILSVLPVVLVSLISLTAITTLLNQRVILSKSNEQMTAILSDYASRVEGDIDTLCTETSDLAEFIGSTYTTTKIENYEDAITRIVRSNDRILGAGLWFEPNTYDKTSKFYGPYWYKSLSDKGVWDNGKIEKSLEYSSETYNYFDQGYYKNAKNLEIGTAAMTEPYYDETTGFIMITCSSPIYSKDNKFVGCVTIDIMCDYIETFFNTVKVGNTGRMMLLDGNYNYLYHPEYENAAKQGIALHDTKEIGTDIELNDSGRTELNIDNIPTLLYWMKIPNTTWKIGLLINEAEVLADSEKLIITGVIICILSVIICTAVILVHAHHLTRAAKSIAESLYDLSEGDFHKINKYANKKDEFGVMIKSVNLLVEKLSAVSWEIKRSVSTIAAASDDLLDESTVLAESSSAVNSISKTISDGITNRKNKTETALDRFDALSRQLEALAVNIEKAKDDLYNTPETTVSFDTSMFDEIQKSISGLSSAVKEVSDSVSTLSNIQLSMSESLDNLSANLTQMNLLAMKSSAKAARFGDFGTTTVVLIDEISKLSEKSSDIVYHAKDEISQISSSYDNIMTRISDLSKITTNTETAVSKLPEKIDIPVPKQDTVDLKNISNSIRLCERASIETHNAIKELMRLYEDNAVTMETSDEFVKELNDAIDVIDVNVHALRDSMTDLDKKAAFFKS